MGIDVGDKHLKDTVRAILKLNLLDRKVLKVKENEPTVAPSAAPVSSPVDCGLTFEQQKELLLLQLEHDKFKLQVEMEKELALENVWQKTEEARLEVEQSRLQLIREG